MVRLVCLGVFLCTTGCGGDNNSSSSEASKPADPTGPCAAPVGQYEQVLTLKSGTCGAQASSIVDLSKGGPAVGTFGSQCKGTGTVSADVCKYQVEITCPSTPTNLEQTQLTLYGGTPPTTSFVTTTNWNLAGTHATGLWSIQRKSPVADCGGTYDVELTQL
jgi:hypothetical protein